MLGDRAYKLRKPVRFDFVDLSTRAARRRMSEREVRLNRRLAPDVYLGVADVVVGDVVRDHLVVMRRLPPERRLSTLLADHDVGREIDAVARRVAAFHASVETSAEISAAASPAVLREKLDADLEGLASAGGARVDLRQLERVSADARSYLDGRERLLEQRMRSGLVRDGHGDLLADDIFCLDDGPRILDCLEFDDRLRWCDVLADLAFLAMDLERLGAPAAAERLLAAYQEYSGEHHPASLFHWYVGTRAVIRAKVTFLRWGQSGDERDVEAACRLLDIAERRFALARVRLVLVGGSPGTGKSTLAKGLSDREGWTLLRSDEVRKDISGLGHGPSPADARREIYTDDRTRATYEELLRRAEVAMGLGESVVLDATWGDAGQRAEAAVLAGRAHAELHELVCDAPPSVVAARIARRRQAGRDASDADESVAVQLRAAFEAWPSARVVDTSYSERAALDGAVDALSAR